MNEMKDILTGTKTALQSAASLSYINDTDIYITIDEDLIPNDVTFPAIAIKDGTINYLVQDASGNWDPDAYVDVIIYQEIKDGDKSIMSDTGFPRIYGLIEIAKDVHAVLFDNKLSIADVESVVPVGERGTEVVYTKDLALIKKVITYRYGLYTSPTE